MCAAGTFISGKESPGLKAVLLNCLSRFCLSFGILSCIGE